MNILLARAWFFCFLVLPSLADTSFQLDSRGRTNIVLAAIAVALSAGKFRTLRLNQRAVMLLLVLLAWSTVALAVSPLELDAPGFIGTGLGLVVAFILAHLLANAYQATPAETVRRLAKGVFLDSTLVGIVSLSLFKLDIQLMNLNYFPFSEPAHFARMYGPIALLALYASDKVLFRLATLGFTLMFALLFPSLSMLLYTVLGALIYVLSGSRKEALNLFRVIAVGVVALAVYASLNTDDLEYFLERVSVSDQSTNYTTLVFLQGVEAARSSLLLTHGFGIGLHQLGLEPPNAITDHIEWLGYQSGHRGFELNRRDGGFVAAKLVAELGILGLLMALGVLVLQARALVAFIRYRGQPGQDKRIFAGIVLMAFSIEFFLRGAGYFSLPLMMAVAMILWLAQIGQAGVAPRVQPRHVTVNKG